MVEYVKGKIRVYQRNIKRKLKDGKTKTYQTHQQQVTLDKNDILVDGETVAVVPLETFKTYIESTSTNKDQLKELLQVQKKYKDITETNQELTNDIKRLKRHFPAVPIKLILIAPDDE